MGQVLNSVGNPMDGRENRIDIVRDFQDSIGKESDVNEELLNIDNQYSLQETDDMLDMADHWLIE